MNYESSHIKKAEDGSVKREIFKILLEGSCNRRDLRWKLGLRGLKISSKAVDYHLRRGKKGLINEGIVREEDRLLNPILDSNSLPKIIRYLSLDPKTESRVNENLSYAYLRAITFLDLISIEDRDYKRYKEASENLKNKKVEEIEIAVETILNAYEYDAFIGETLQRNKDLKGPILNYASLSPKSALFNEIRPTYESGACKRFVDDILLPSLANGPGTFSIYETGTKSSLLRKIHEVSLIIQRIENSHLDIVIKGLSEKAKRLQKISPEVSGFEERAKKHLWRGGPEVIR
jgi:hypothetical protein